MYVEMPYWMDYAAYVNGVDIIANDDDQAYQFMINGAVCAVQAYDGIRVGRDEGERYWRHLDEIFQDRSRTAQQNYLNHLGPIYV
jgi:hypothetical protein